MEKRIDLPCVLMKKTKIGPFFDEKRRFFKKSYEKVWRIGKTPLSLHPLNEQHGLLTTKKSAPIAQLVRAHDC